MGIQLSRALLVSVQGQGAREMLVKYDEDGYVKSIKSYYTGMDAINEETDEPSIQNYTIVEKDAMGNWIRRKSSQGTETRTIEYF